MNQGTIVLKKSKNGRNKWEAVFPDGRTVKFGSKNHSDYTLHKDKNRKTRYLDRHRARENWKPSGRMTPGFWSRHVGWSKPDLHEAIAHTEKILKQKIVLA